MGLRIEGRTEVDRPSGRIGGDRRQTGRGDLRLAVFLVVAVAFYRSIVFWTLNAWDLSSPDKILLIAGVLALAGVALVLALARIGLAPLPSGFVVSAAIALLMHWQQLHWALWIALLCLVVVVSWVVHRTDARSISKGIAWAAIAAFGVVPFAQLAVAHFQDAVPYPLVSVDAPAPVEASNLVDDVVVVIVDTYPSLPIRQTWLNRDSGELVDTLRDQGFTVPSSAWSRHTYTALSVPSILQLQSVVEPGATGPWGNRSSAYSILRGDSFVSSALRSAGFRYTHIESGWDGSSCGPSVDMCIESPWIDEPVWQLLAPSVLNDWLQTRIHTITGTFNVVAVLEQELAALSGNGMHDYVFGHLLLPHDPYVVDASCGQLDVDRLTDNAASGRRAAFSEQVACVDRLLTSALSDVADKTAILVTGDHGGSTGHQVARDADTWSDADIAERFGVFLAYKLPAGCSAPQLDDPLSAMALVLSCALTETYEVSPPEYLIGALDPQQVAPLRMARIRLAVEQGVLTPDQ